jgi:hypothetical protein
MPDLETRVAAIRQEMDRVKAALETARDEAERRLLHMRLNECIRTSIRLIYERLEVYDAYLAGGQQASQGTPPLERSVGKTGPA